MRIAVVGSWSAYQGQEPRGTLQEFVTACEEIGRELARLGQTVLVVARRPNSGDLHVVNGMLRVLEAEPDNGARIKVLTENREPYEALARKYPKIFSFPPILPGWWAEKKLLQILEADAVVTIGGAEGTHQAGLAAIVARKTLVPVGSFGGASSGLVTQMQALAPGSPVHTHLSTLNGPWTSHVLDTVMTLLGVSQRPRLLIIHGRSEDRHKLIDWLKTTLELTDLLIMQQEFGGGLSLPEKFEQLAAKADGAIALATPDDRARRGVNTGHGHGRMFGWNWDGSGDASAGARLC